MSLDLPRLLGPYVLLDQLGGGSHGTTYLARARTGRTPLVIKRLRDEVLHRADLRARLVHEARVAVAIDDPRVVRALDVGVVGDVPYLAMELVDGWPLVDVLRLCHEQRALWPPGAVVAVVAELLRGLEALHGAIDPATGVRLEAVHRDLSPHNVMLRPSGQPVLIDLGLGRSVLREWETATGSLMGTPGYMAPEQVLRLAVDHRADLYAAGVLAFELLTMERYIPSGDVTRSLRATCDGAYRPPSGINPAIPAALDAVVERAVAVDAGDRYPTAAALREALCAAVAPDPEAVPRCVPEALRQLQAVRRASRAVLLLTPTPEAPEREPQTTIYAQASRRAPTEVWAASVPPAEEGERTAVDARALVGGGAAGVRLVREARARADSATVGWDGAPPGGVPLAAPPSGAPPSGAPPSGAPPSGAPVTAGPRARSDSATDGREDGRRPEPKRLPPRADSATDERGPPLPRSDSATQGWEGAARPSLRKPPPRSDSATQGVDPSEREAWALPRVDSVTDDRAQRGAVSAGRGDANAVRGAAPPLRAPNVARGGLTPPEARRPRGADGPMLRPTQDATQKAEITPARLGPDAPPRPEVELRAADGSARRAPDPAAYRAAEALPFRAADAAVPRAAEAQALRTVEPAASRGPEAAPRNAEPAAPRAAEPAPSRAAEPAAPRAAEPAPSRTAEASPVRALDARARAGITASRPIPDAAHRIEITPVRATDHAPRVEITAARESGARTDVVAPRAPEPNLRTEPIAVRAALELELRSEIGAPRTAPDARLRAGLTPARSSLDAARGVPDATPRAGTTPDRAGSDATHLPLTAPASPDSDTSLRAEVRRSSVDATVLRAEVHPSGVDATLVPFDDATAQHAPGSLDATHLRVEALDADTAIPLRALGPADTTDLHVEAHASDTATSQRGVGPLDETHVPFAPGTQLTPELTPAVVPGADTRIPWSPAPPPRRSAALLVALLAVVVAGLGVAGAWVALDDPEPQVIAPAPDLEADPGTAAAITARPAPGAIEATSSTTAIDGASPPAATPGGEPTGARSPRSAGEPDPARASPRPAAASPPAPSALARAAPASAAPARSPHERLEDLIERASARRRERPDQVAALEALIAEASGWLDSRDEVRVTAAADRLEQRLAQLPR